MIPRFRGRAAILLGLFLLALAGCAPTPPAPDSGPPPYAELAEQARAAREAGDSARSAALFETAAEQADSPDREILLLQSALARLDGDDPEGARRIAEEIATASVPPAAGELRRLVLARLALTEDDPQRARNLLSPRASVLDGLLLAEWLAVEADARLRLSDALGAAHALDRRAGLLETEQARADNHERLWQALRELPMETLRQLVPPPVPDRFGGWLELAYLIRENRLDTEALTAEVTSWQDRYPDHPASGAFAAELLERLRQQLRPPASLALLLPLSGPLADAGEAVRRGFLGAYYMVEPDQRPRLQVHDVGTEGKDSLSAYRDAVEGGADLVVGPLSKQSLEMLTVWDRFPVPVLALNRLPDGASPSANLFQFGLAPEDEARAAAHLAHERKLLRAVALVPANDWGDRTATAFRQALEAPGGTVLETARYEPDESDFSFPIREVFNLDASYERRQRLQSTIGRNLEFQPRRRQDMQTVFLAAFPREARLLRPQIRFHHGIDVPVLATSHAYSGHPDPQADQDMDGLLLVDMPWLHDSRLPEELATIHARMQELWPTEERNLPRLYALGVDAFRIVSVLPALRQEPTLTIPGASGGSLSVEEDGIVRREVLVPMRFRDGAPTPLPGTAPLDGEKAP